MSCGRSENCTGSGWRKSARSALVGDKVFTCTFMQLLAAASLQCIFDGISATDTLPVCSHTTVMMPEPIHNIIVDNRIESVMYADFLIFRTAKVVILFRNKAKFCAFFQWRNRKRFVFNYCLAQWKAVKMMLIRQNGWECLQTSLFPTPRVECLDGGDNGVVSTFRVSVNWEVCVLCGATQHKHSSLYTTCWTTQLAYLWTHENPKLLNT